MVSTFTDFLRHGGNGTAQPLVTKDGPARCLLTVSVKSGPPNRRSLEQDLSDRLAAAFAGIINVRHQRALGIDQYVW